MNGKLITDNHDSTLTKIERRLAFITKHHTDKKLIEKLNRRYETLLEIIDNYNIVINIHRNEVSDKIYRDICNTTGLDYEEIFGSD